MFAQKIKLKISAKKIAYWSYAAIIAFFALTVFFSYTFLNDNFYRIITGEKYYQLSTIPAGSQDRINLNSFNEVIKNIDKKTASATRETVNNPFN